ncbi:hypothetical protein ACFMPD_02650 [Sedimentitalea sp. HM32M-2]|uniref:hypothetical protein n=1 Tax=Sedimentitalea sp. HM32M-2 TaxID=3351566 RepID=UPI0036455AA4
MNLFLDAQVSGFTLSGYGSNPARPIINAVTDTDGIDGAALYHYGGFGGGVGTPDIRLVGLDFRGTCDPTVERSDRNDIGKTHNAFVAIGRHEGIIHDCRFKGFKGSILSLQYGKQHRPFRDHIDDCEFTDFGGQYPIFVGPGDDMSSAYSFTGSGMMQNPAATDTDQGTTGATRATMRIETLKHVHMRGADIPHRRGTAYD